jgi:Diacylglycerol acyltransferase
MMTAVCAVADVHVGITAGFVRMAMQQGADILPAFAFG